ncbi:MULTISPECIES: hypothetical protein [unclassified Spirosoma]|uniref:hypothetical protein n=1 Tax=unclassified Spirosoma TaxID=2621999 RepID=UPI000960217B|nr:MULTISPECIES: hypothetical protein [unclassified Spirosoma]MBN8825750.1 hypothetical protein [Spirosoma sp.]OJW76562.1 MAG: hypothetical protein BGO59_05730 [Spirosoma sp. 48-14]
MAIDKAIGYDRQQHNWSSMPTYRCSIEPSAQMPEMSIVDYMLWALQRYILRNEIRFWEAIEHKMVSVLDLYDQENPEGNLYEGVTKPFRLEKAGPFFGQ